jgi:hypothetical protein
VRIVLIASGGYRLTAELPDAVASSVRVVRTCDPRDQKTSGEHRHVYFVFRHTNVFVQADVADVACETVEVEQ